MYNRVEAVEILAKSSKLSLLRQFYTDAVKKRTVRYIILLSLILGIGVCTKLYAQEPSTYQVEGILVDSAGIAIEQANVRLLSDLDTLNTVSTEGGKFSFQAVKAKRFQLRFRHLAYIEKIFEVRVQEGKRPYEVGKIVMQTKFVKLDEISVEKQPPMVFKGDTVEFETRHLQLEEGAFTEDLMRLLPGMEVTRDGRLSYMGEPVVHARINGIDFFGGDVPLALKNLPADLMNKVQIIDDYGEEAGVKSGKAQKVLNLLVDDDKNRGVFTNGDIGTGTAHTYKLTGGGNYFNKQRQLGLKAGKNNINQITVQSNVINTPSSAGGITTNSGLGVDISDAFGNWMKGNFSYQHLVMDNLLESTTLDEQTYEDNRIMRTETTRESRQNSRSHELVNPTGLSGLSIMLAKYKTSFRILPKFRNIESTATTSENNWQQLWENDRLTSNQRTISESTTDGIQRNGSVAITSISQLNSRGRSLMVTGNYANNTGQHSENRENRISFLNQSDIAEQDSLQQQEIHTLDESSSLNLALNYSEPIGAKHKLIFNTAYRRNRESDNRQVYDRLQDMAFIDSLSNSTDFRQNRTTLTATIQGNKALQYTVSLNWVFLDQVGRLNTAGERSQRVSSYVVPNIRLTHNTSKGQTLLVYLWQVSQPGFSQLNPVANRANPQVTLLGNPDLAPSLTHQLQIQWLRYSKGGSGSITTRLESHYIQDKITQNVSLIREENGLTRQQYRFENVSGDYRIAGFYAMNRSLFQATAQKSRTINLSGSAYIMCERFLEEGKTRQSFITGIQQEIYSSISEGKWAFHPGVGYSLEHNSIRNLRGMQTLHTLSPRLSTAMPLWYNFNLDVGLSKMFNWGYTGSANRNPTILYLALGSSLLKKKLNFSLAVQDLLNQNISVGRTVNRNGVSDYSTNAMGRYVFLSCSYRFGKFGNKMSF